MIYAVILLGVNLFFLHQLKTQNTKIMDELEQIKADLEASREFAKKIKADVERLHSKIDALTDGQITHAKIAELKALSSELRASLEGVDAQTEEETSTEETV